MPDWRVTNDVSRHRGIDAVAADVIPRGSLARLAGPSLAELGGMSMHPKLRRYVERRQPVWPVFALAFGFGLTVLVGVKALAADRRFCSPEDRGAIARAMTQKLALDAYPQWVVDHPDRTLTQIDELCEYTNDKVAIDPWGARYLMIPTGAAIIVGSMGPDKVLGTADDIWSAQP